MISHNERITLRQMQFLLILGAMGTGLIILPRRAAEFVQQDGWLIVLGLTVLGMALAALVTSAARVKPGAGFIEYTSYALSKPVAYLCGALLWGKLVLAAGLELRAFLLITRQVLLPETPLWLVSALMLAVCAYAAVKGIEARARIAEVLVPLLVLWLIFLFVVALMDIDLSNLQPVMATPPRRIFSGVMRLGFVFTGLECLLLTSPFIAREKKMPRAAVIAVGAAGLVITAVTALTLAKFGTGTAAEPWPVLRMMDMLRLPGSFIERQEALMFSFWIITVFALVNALLFFGGVLMKEISAYTVPRRAVCTILTTAAVFAVTCIPWESAAIEARLDFMFCTAGVFFLIVFPLAVLAGAGIRKKWHRRKQHSSLLLLCLLAAPLFTLAGCYDRVEIEDRVLVTAIHLDKDEENYRMTVLLSNTDEGENDDDDDTTDNNARESTAAAPTLTAAMQQLNKAANARLYYGHAKVLALGDALLQDAAMTKNVFTTLINNPQFDRQISVIALPPHSDAPLHTPFYSTDLGAIWQDLNENGHTLIPCFSNGAVALKDFAKKIFLEEKELRGYLWCFPGALHIDTPVPFVTDRHNAQVHFTPYGNDLKAIITVEAFGRAPELPDDITPAHARELIAAAIADKIRAAAALLQENNLDAYHWLEHMYKKQPALHARYAHRWHEIFPALQIEPRVSVRINE